MLMEKINRCLKEQLSKKEYLPPEIEVTIVEMENGIAAQSALVVPVNSAGDVKHDWDEGGTVDKEIEW
ncbi:hypothetical protein ATB99_10845 [Elizabethkingia meningoseptica]|uniref:hypothetical protein n=2 Tax=Elizabethkingia meningoseptica TaxID=238 RepID=UPI000332D0DF|nr:hypothetical protein [Elizabethkingia meningoseptica]AQX06861.1 hypothetical protein BBD33_17035 [Elizabethkingia meningoseptica]AQX48907.1 hypothetical protein B5G46_17020 [Elizabethkingia meningoseptica]EOR29429.1 hypothetical protein L100_11298 [Elizabethkingia meningoseptica ATCC 13253 = NBRC 12535]KUY14993.1 hypothetical protein ATB99_10845 [Elizabethkingia meningoseptica]OPB69636.1 hypothetical protein BAY30_05765 [Elizabethkingia meningoseptica]